MCTNFADLHLTFLPLLFCICVLLLLQKEEEFTDAINAAEIKAKDAEALAEQVCHAPILNYTTMSYLHRKSLCAVPKHSMLLQCTFIQAVTRKE
jgi:hypothetical protein